MAIFHFTVKIVGRSKGKSIISASAYLNGDVMKNEETGKVSYYTGKKEVVYSSLMMCENAPPEWLQVPDENIRRFRNSIRYKRAEDKEAAIEKFKMTFQKQRLWNEVLKVEKSADAQLGRSFEFSLPKEWSRQEQIAYTTDFVQRSFVAKGMCADWSIHDKGDGNPHVHLLVTMRPFQEDHTWGNKEVKEWAFVRDKNGNILIDESHPDWWQDKKNPERHGIRIPLLDANGNQKLDSRNRKQWKRETVDATGWNHPKNCELWRSEWAKECNLHLSKEQQVDHRSYDRQGKMVIPTIHEGADARRIDEKFQSGQATNASWKVEENRIIKKQNAILQKLQKIFGQVGILLQQWKERLHDIRRKQRSHSYDGGNDRTDRGTTEALGGNVPGAGAEGCSADFARGADSKLAGIKQRVARTASNLARYRRHVGTSREAGWQDSGIGNRKSTMERIGGEVEQREWIIAETERGIAEVRKRIEKVRDVDERIKRIKARRADGGTAGSVGEYAIRGRSEREGDPAAGQRDQNTAGATERIAELMRETEQREQSRERTSIKERLEANKRIIEEREREREKSRSYDRGISR